MTRMVLLGTALTVTTGCSASTPTAPPTLTSITITGLSGSLTAGSSVQLTARATTSDGTSRDVTADSAWQSSNVAAATVNATGRVTGISTGTSLIQAMYQGRSANV